MKKIILLIFSVAISAASFGQVKVFTDQLITDSATFDRTNWVNEFDLVISGAGTNRQVPTSKAVVDYIALTVPGLVNVDISGIRDTTSALWDSIGAHMTILSNHEGRVAAMEALDHDHTNKSILDNITVAYTTAINSAITAYQDSTHRLTDTAGVHNLRLKALEILAHAHDNQAILDAITAAFTTAAQTRLAGVNDTAMVILRVTEDTLTATVDSSGWIFPIPLELNGFELVSVQAYSPGNGNGTAAIEVFRRRSTTEVDVTSSGADINGTATINPVYNDIATGDYYSFGFSESGATIYTVAVDVFLKFLRP